MHGEQPGIGTQDLLVQQLQRWTWPDAKLLVVQPVHLLVGGKGGLRSAASGLCHHELSPQVLAERLRLDQPGEFGCHLLTTPGRKGGIRPPLDGEQPQFLQSRHLGLEQWADGQQPG